MRRARFAAVAVVTATALITGCSNSSEPQPGDSGSSTGDGPTASTAQWALSSILAPQAWRTSTGDPSVKVAVIDSGISPIADFKVPVQSWACRDQCVIEDEPADVTSHGTEVASIIAANGWTVSGSDSPVWGVAPGVSLLSFRVVEGDGPNRQALAAAAKAAVDQGAAVVNMSTVIDGADPALAAIISAAPNTLFVVAAGDQNRSVDTPGGEVSPCTDNLPNVICVTAVDRVGALVPNSNYGKTSVDLGAPGGDVLVVDKDNQSQIANGTAFAAPFVTGTAALIFSARADIRGAAVIPFITKNAFDDLGLRGKTVTGARLDAGGAMAAAIAPTPRPRPSKSS